MLPKNLRNFMEKLAKKIKDCYTGGQTGDSKGELRGSGEGETERELREGGGGEGYSYLPLSGKCPMCGMHDQQADYKIRVDLTKGEAPLRDFVHSYGPITAYDTGDEFAEYVYICWKEPKHIDSGKVPVLAKQAIKKHKEEYLQQQEQVCVS